jgi:hypothetical protein
MERITQDDIEDLEDRGFPKDFIERAKQWLIDQNKGDDLVAEIEVAFADVRLGNGVGLFEAKGLDDYASDEERQQFRSKDQKHDWKLIPDEHLNECYSSPSFFDTAGFIFHLPALMRAEIRGSYHHDFFGRLIHGTYPQDLVQSLTDSQKSAVIHCLELLRKSPEYDDEVDDIDNAIRRFRI